jgi:hypothetical protein
LAKVAGNHLRGESMERKRAGLPGFGAGGDGPF